MIYNQNLHFLKIGTKGRIIQQQWNHWKGIRMIESAFSQTGLYRLILEIQQQNVNLNCQISVQKCLYP